jgi:RNA polymerase sigma-70 factor (ECF subfamily)
MHDQQTSGLIRAAQGGDAAGFAELVDLYYDTIYRFAWKWCGNRDDAQDIAQLSCVKLAASVAQFRFQAAFTTWLYQLVISCAQDWQRAQRRHAHAELADDPPWAGASDAEDSVYLVQLLAQLDALGEGMKETALLVHAEGFSHAEAGRILGVTESTISWRIHTMRKHLNRHEAMAGGAT